MQKGGLKTNCFLGVLKLKINSCWTGCYSNKTLIPFLCAENHLKLSFQKGGSKCWDLCETWVSRHMCFSFNSFMPGGLLTVKWTYHVFLCGFVLNYQLWSMTFLDKVVFSGNIRWHLLKTPSTSFVHRLLRPQKHFRLQKDVFLWRFFGVTQATFCAETWLITIPSWDKEVVNHLLGTTKSLIFRVALLTSRL